MDWSSRTKLNISGISLELGFNFYQCELTEGLEHEENLHTESFTAYHNTLEWYNEWLFSDQEGEEDLLLVDKDLIRWMMMMTMKTQTLCITEGDSSSGKKRAIC